MTGITENNERKGEPYKSPNRNRMNFKEYNKKNEDGLINSFIDKNYYFIDEEVKVKNNNILDMKNKSTSFKISRKRLMEDINMPTIKLINQSKDLSQSSKHSNFINSINKNVPFNYSNTTYSKRVKGVLSDKTYTNKEIVVGSRQLII